MNHIRKIPQQGYVYNVINKLIDAINYILDNIEGKIIQYTAGTGINITDDVISVDTTTIPTKENLNAVSNKAFNDYVEINVDVSSEENIFAELDNYTTPGIYKLNISNEDGSKIQAELFVCKEVGVTGYVIKQIMNLGDGIISGRQWNSTSETWSNITTIDTTSQNNHTHGQYIQQTDYDSDMEVIARTIADLQQRVAALEGNINV